MGRFSTSVDYGKCIIVTVVIVACCGGTVLGSLRKLAYEGNCVQPAGKLASNLDLNWVGL